MILIVILIAYTKVWRYDFKSSKTLSNNIKANEFGFIWLNAKANVETLIDGKEESFDIRVKIKEILKICFDKIKDNTENKQK
jgi:hypothetical protein